jgi:hypothetical protein
MTVDPKEQQHADRLLSTTAGACGGGAQACEPGKQSNRLSSSTGGIAPPELYSHDAHGNMLSMPQLQVMQWDFKDQLRLTRRQRVNDNDADGIKHEGERTYYVYDASGQRVRKVTELSTGGVKDERIYLGGFEIFRTHGGTVSPVGAGTAILERETLHAMDDKQRIALVETRTFDAAGNDQTPRQMIRYQLGNHLGSASLELDDQAQIISYEEYAPYGSSTYQVFDLSGGTKPDGDGEAVSIHGEGAGRGERARLSRCAVLPDMAGKVEQRRSGPAHATGPDTQWLFLRGQPAHQCIGSKRARHRRPAGVAVDR